MDDKNILYIYIDESGSMDFRKNERYFVVCALVVSEAEGNNISRTVKYIIGKKNLKSIKDKELHASQMSFDDKSQVFKHLVHTHFQLYYMVVDKAYVNKSFFNHKNACFNHMVQTLLHTLLIEETIIHLYITVDNRNLKIASEKSLEECLYVELLKNNIYSKNLHVRYMDSKKNKCLQAVDLFVNAIYAKYNYNKDYFYAYIRKNIVKKIYIPKLDSENEIP